MHLPANIDKLDYYRIGLEEKSLTTVLYSGIKYTDYSTLLEDNRKNSAVKNATSTTTTTTIDTRTRPKAQLSFALRLLFSDASGVHAMPALWMSVLK